MSAVSFLKRLVVATGLVLTVLAAGSCRKREQLVEVPVVVAPELNSNRLGGLPGAVYASQARSAVHWQPWEQATFQRAGAARRLVLVVIALPQYRSFYGVMRELEADAALVATINEHYVPILVDGEAAREVGLLTMDLAGEDKQQVQLPMWVWMTAARNPVAWTSVRAGRLRGVFDKSHALLSRTWANSPEYIANKGAEDNASRRLRLAARSHSRVASKEPAADVVRAIRQLTTLYDPVSRSFDDVGGLFPTGMIEAVSGAVLCPAVKEEVRARSLRMLKEMMVDLLPSAMFDPLDGGLFSSRRGMAWDLPVFERDGSRQAQAVVALCRVYHATGDPEVLERALGILASVESANATADGLYALGSAPAKLPMLWLWTVAEVQTALPPEDAAWWIKATGMKGVGNLPLESDPTREFFRRNSLGMSQRKAAIAAELALTPEGFAARYEATRKRLLAIRDARLIGEGKDETAHAATTLRMVSALAAAYCATGEPAFRERAVKRLTQARQAFCDGVNLRMYATQTAPPVSAGRAFLYALAMQASLDVADVTEDEKWLAWAGELATTAAERFATAEGLAEVAAEARLLDLPITDEAMLFEESTVALMAFAETRLAARGRPMAAVFSQLTQLPLSALERPILHTDLIQAAMVRHHGALVLMGADLPAALQRAVTRLPLRLIKRRAATAADAVPAGTLRILLAEGTSREVTTSEDLRNVFLPSAPNQ
jgi:uncharacterized protein YyaL (SSP411 family)